MHLPLLRLPYFWDEAGYFIPAARDILLTGDLIPHTTLSNAHPPLVMLWLALCWKLTAYSPLVTRTAMLLVAAVRVHRAVAAGKARGQRPGGQRERGAYGAVSHGVLAVGDGTARYRRVRTGAVDALLRTSADGYWQAVAFAALAAVAKETTVAVTLTLAGAGLLGWFAYRWWPALAGEWCLPRRTLERTLGRTLATSAAYLLALLPLAGWYAYHFHRTGHVFGNPDYLRYNVGATVTPLRILLAGLMRLWHATGYMNLFVLTGAAVVLLWSGHQPGAAFNAAHDTALAPGIATNVQLLLALVVLAQAVEFSVVGGALLARYMIPAIPLVVLLAVDVLRRYAPQWKWWVAGCAAAFVAALFLNPPWFISPEDNLTWASFVRMHQEAARYVEQHYAEDRILTAWPASDELNRPFLGYVARPLSVVRLENFTAEEILRAQQQPESFDEVVAFSTKYEPPRGFFRHIPGWTYVQTRYFDFHQDLPPALIAHMLHGRIVWQDATPGEWIAVIEIDKARLAGVQGFGSSGFRVSKFQGFKVGAVRLFQPLLF